jgi:SAM-dependent methyltransferase
MMAELFTGMTEAQRLDAVYFHTLWAEMREQGQIEPIVPTDEVMWQRDLGRSLKVAFDWLGDLRGQRILELGCGPGDYTIMLARRGAQVTALDIAPASLEITRWRAQVNQVERAIQVNCMAAETLAFPDATFDGVVGFGVAHHADTVALAPEIRRVLRPGGRALFREPLGANLLLHFVREHIPYRDKHRSRNEHPLNYLQINKMGDYFSAMRVREFYLFSMISRAIGGEMSFPTLWALDEFLIQHIPLIRQWCRYILVEYSL